MSAAEREEQLKVQLLQQEAAMQALQDELRALREGKVAGDENDETGHHAGRRGSATRTAAGGRPHTAGSGRSAASAIAKNAASHPPPDSAVMYKVFPAHYVEPAAHSPIPMALEGHTAVPTGGKVYMFGGTNSQQINGDVWQYTVGSRKWRRLKPTAGHQYAIGRYGHSGVYYNHQMVVFGGFGPGGNPGNNAGMTTARCGLLTSMSAFDVNTHEWTVIDDGHDVDPVKNHSAVVCKRKMYVFGGCLLEGRTNAVRCYDFDRSKWVAAEPLNQQAMAAASNSVTTLARSDVPAPRSGHTANLYTRNGQHAMVVFGGRLGKHAFCNDVFTYNFDTHLWARLYCGGQAPPARCDHSAVLYKDHLIVYGGYAVNSRSAPADGSEGPATGNAAGDSRKVYFDDCYALHLVSCTWRKVGLVGQMRPLGGCGHTSILYENPDEQIMMQIHGGWGAVEIAPSEQLDEDVERTAKYLDGNVVHRAMDATWEFIVANAAAEREQEEALKPKRPTTAGNSRPGTAGRGGRPTSARPSSARPSSARAADRSTTPRDRNASRPRFNSDGTPIRKPWCVQTSKATTAKYFGEPPHKPKPPVVRLEYQVDSIVKRLADDDVRRSEENRRRLEDKFIKVKAPARMSMEEQSESVERLYYQQTEWKAEKQKQLETKWVPVRETATADLDIIMDSVNRLHHAPPKKEPEVPNVSKKQTRQQTDECVSRLYTEQRESSIERHRQLEKKYLWGAEEKKMTREGMEAMMSRLASGGGSPRKA